MALKHILLGTLSVLGPRSGYEIHKIILKVGRPKLPQVYNCLKDLKKEKLVDFDRVHSQDEPTRNIYSITASGQKELQDWLEKHDDVEPMREPLMAKVWFGKIVDKAAIINDLKSFAEQRQVEIAFYQRILATDIKITNAKRKSKDPLDKYYLLKASNYMIARGKAEVEWAYKTIEDLQNTDFDAIKQKAKQRKV